MLILGLDLAVSLFFFFLTRNIFILITQPARIWAQFEAEMQLIRCSHKRIRTVSGGHTSWHHWGTLWDADWMTWHDLWLIGSCALRRPWFLVHNEDWGRPEMKKFYSILDFFFVKPTMYKLEGIVNSVVWILWKIDNHITMYALLENNSWKQFLISKSQHVRN